MGEHRNKLAIEQWESFCIKQEIIPIIILEEGLVFLDKIDNLKKIQKYVHKENSYAWEEYSSPELYYD